MLSQIHAQHVAVFDERGLRQSVDERDARAPTVRVQHEFRRVQPAFGIPLAEPSGNVGQQYPLSFAYYPDAGLKGLKANGLRLFPPVLLP